MKKKVSSENVVKDIRRQTRRKYSSEEKIRIVLEGLRGEDSISSLCRREGILSNQYYRIQFEGRIAKVLVRMLDTQIFVFTT